MKTMNFKLENLRFYDKLHCHQSIYFFVMTMISNKKNSNIFTLLLTCFRIYVLKKQIICACVRI